MLEFLIDSINGSRLFAGVMMLLLNVGSKFVLEDISKTQEEWFSNQLLRRLVIFAICFVATRDVVTSIILTAGFIIFTSGLAGKGDHPMRILPKSSSVAPRTPHDSPFGMLRVQSIPGLPPVQNTADDRISPVIFTT